MIKRSAKIPEARRTAGGKRRVAEGLKSAWRLEDIQKLIDSLVEREISEFEMEQNGLRIRVRRGQPPTVVPSSLMAPVSMVVPQSVAVASGPAAVTPVAPSSGTAPAGTPETAEPLHIIKSPIVGTFYRSSSPKAEPFVNVGDVVREGQVLCIIEAMKLMNEIESELAGEVNRIYVKNGQPVEYGQPLFAIRASAAK